MFKCNFNKVAKQFYWNHTLAWVFSCKFAAYFQNTFHKNTYGRLLFLSTSYGFYSLNIVSSQFQSRLLFETQLTTIKYFDYTHQSTHLLGNHRVSVYHIHQHAVPSLDLPKKTFHAKVVVFDEVLLHLDQLLSQLLEHSLYVTFVYIFGVHLFTYISYTFRIHLWCIARYPTQQPL